MQAPVQFFERGLENWSFYGVKIRPPLAPIIWAQPIPSFVDGVLLS